MHLHELASMYTTLPVSVSPYSGTPNCARARAPQSQIRRVRSAIAWGCAHLAGQGEAPLYSSNAMPILLGKHRPLRIAARQEHCMLRAQPLLDWPVSAPSRKKRQLQSSRVACMMARRLYRTLAACTACGSDTQQCLHACCRPRVHACCQALPCLLQGQEREPYRAERVRTSPMAASCSPAALAGSLMRKLLVSTTHCALASAQDASSSSARAAAGRGSSPVSAAALPLVDAAQLPSIEAAPARKNSGNELCSATGIATGARPETWERPIQLTKLG